MIFHTKVKKNVCIHRWYANDWKIKVYQSWSIRTVTLVYNTKIGHHFIVVQAAICFKWRLINIVKHVPIFLLLNAMLHAKMPPISMHNHKNQGNFLFEELAWKMFHTFKTQYCKLQEKNVATNQLSYCVKAIRWSFRVIWNS